MVSLKNIQKVASGQPVNFGKELLQRSIGPHLKKKAKSKDKAVALQAESEIAQLNAASNSKIKTAEIISKIQKQNPDIGDILEGALGGALGGAGAVLGGSKDVAETGANVIDNTIGVWLQKNWLKLLGGTVLLTGVVIAIVKLFGGKKRTGYRR